MISQERLHTVCVEQKKRKKKKKMREERVVKGHAFHPSAVWGKERKDLARLEYHTCPACRISGVMQT